MEGMPQNGEIMEKIRTLDRTFKLRLASGLRSADGEVEIPAGEIVTVQIPPLTEIRVWSDDRLYLSANFDELRGGILQDDTTN